MLASGGAHLQPAALPLTTRRSQLLQRVHEGIRVVGRQCEAMDAVGEHLGDTGDVRRDDRQAAHHCLRNDHWSDLIERGEEQHVTLTVILVDVVGDVVQLNAWVTANRRLHLIDVIYLILPNIPSAHHDKPHVLAVLGPLLKDLNGPVLVLARADDAKREEGDRSLGLRHRCRDDLPIRLGLGNANVRDHAVGGLVQVKLRLAHAHGAWAYVERLADHCRRRVLVVTLGQLVFEHVARPPLMQDPH
mmetsp:Transcript_79786/g.158548  ORF Transcript_79786/g.158548 Transcript_79786/m.158548 type:complete len:246 (-) Transcript_79786:519-1256(-)